MQFHDMGKEKSSLLTRLKRAVKKVRFLMDFTMNRWHLASVLRRASSSKRMSFSDRPGLRAACDDDTIYSDESAGGSSSRSGIQRTMSFPSEEDVDKRADMFIANFYRQLQLERQISLELQYCRGNSFKEHQGAAHRLVLVHHPIAIGAELRSIISLKHPYEAHRKAFSIAGGRICLLDWSS
nr:hypothetical protein CFP56_14958 [Quercus suber]